MPSQLFTDNAFKALATETRRQLLDSLRTFESAEMIDVSTLLETIPGRHEDVLVIELHHVDLPLLHDLEYLRWDTTTNEVGKGPRFEELEPILNLNRHRTPISQ